MAAAAEPVPEPNGPREEEEDEEDEEDGAAEAGAGGDGAKKKKKKNKKKNKKKATALEGSLIRIQESKEKGRYCTAARDITPGEIILIEPAYAWAPNGDTNRATVCSHCVGLLASAKAGERYDCGACRMVSYCSTRCHEAAKPLHTLECAALGAIPMARRGTQLDESILHLGIRMAAMHALQPPPEPPRAANVIARATLADNLRLMTNRDKFDSRFQSDMLMATRDLLKLMPECITAGVTTDSITDDVCRLQTNAHGLVDEHGSNNYVGVGMFPRCGLMNHSCRPNATYYPQSTDMYVTAVALIRAGQEVCVQYLDLYLPYELRHEQLKTRRYFDCQCARCAEGPAGDDPAIRGAMCHKCKTINPSVPLGIAPEVTTHPCDQCGASMDVGMVRRTLDRMKTLYDDAERARRERQYARASSLIDDLVRASKGVFNEHHYILHNAYSTGMNAARGIGDMQKALVFTKIMLADMDIVLQPFDIEKANYNKLLAELYENLLSEQPNARQKKTWTEERRAALQRAHENYRSCYGPEHVSVKQMETLLASA